MYRLLGAAASLVLFVSASAVSAQGFTPDLEDAIDLYFTASDGPPPTLTQKSGTFDAAARNLHAYMQGAGWTVNDGLVTCSFGGVPVEWRGDDHTSSSDDTILLVTGATSDPGQGVTGIMSGDNSTVYAVGGSGLSAPNNSDGGLGAAENSGSASQHAAAWGGDGIGDGDGGDATVGCTTGTAFGEGGFAPAAGDGGLADVHAPSDAATAYGGHSQEGNGGSATAGINTTNRSGEAYAYAGSCWDGNGDGGVAEAYAAGYAEAIGGGTVEVGSTGTGGDATADSSTDDAYATGGGSYDGNAGTATAEAPNGHANAVGGNASGDGNGGAADAGQTADAVTSYAEGGDSAGDGDGGAAAATSTGDAEAFGGDAIGAAAGSQGGFAEAVVTSISSGADAYAEGGTGRLGGYGKADCDDGGSGGSGGNAVGVGGDGVHPTSGSSTGGRGWAISTASGGTATADGGDATGGSGTGGRATADGPNNLVDITPGIGNPNGAHAQDPV